MLTIHESANYAAHLIGTNHSSGLIVESTRKSGSAKLRRWTCLTIQMRHDHPQFADYVDALRTAASSKQADALCKTLLA